MARKCFGAPVGVILCALLCLQFSHGAIMAIDFGSQFIKVGMVQKGKLFHIVVDETSKRKTPAIVAFDDGERRFGNGAKSLVVRKPGTTFEKMRNLLGVSPESEMAKDFIASGYPHKLESTPDGRGTISVNADVHGNMTYLSVEQIVAMSLEHIKRICETDAEEPVVDAVITVPGFWNTKQREAMLNAGALAGLNVLSLINDNTAAAVQHGIDLDYKPNMTEYVAIYNMGDSTTQVSVVKYSSYTKFKKTIGQLEMLATATDPFLGGSAFDRVITDRLVEEFNALAQKKGHAGYNVRDSPKALAKIKKAAIKAKHVLSANQEVPIYVESLALDIDFRSHLTREEFLKLADVLISKVSKPLTEALEKASVQAEDLKTTLIIGGSVRIPAVQAELKDALGSPNSLGFSLDGDEAIALGSSFIAANLSTAFKVRPIGLLDRLQTPIQIQIDSPEKEAEGEQEALPAFRKTAKLFTETSRLGSKKSVNFRHSRDFDVKVAYKGNEEGEAGLGITQVSITGLETAVENTKNATDEKPKVQLSFRLTKSGTVQVTGASVSIQKKSEVKTKTKEKSPLDSLDIFNQTYARCESDDETPSCSACSHYTLSCKTFSECAERESNQEDSSKKANDDPAKWANMVLRLPLSGSVCTYDKKSDEKDAGCYTTNGPCYVTEKSEKSSESGEEAQKTQDSTDSEAATAEGDASAEENEAKTNKTEPEFKLIWVRKQLKTKISELGDLISLSKDQLAKEKAVLVDLAVQDKRMQMIAQAKNVLESYVYSSRGLLREESGEEVTTEEERDELFDKLMALEDWLYDQEPEDDSVEKFEDKLAEIKALMKPAEHRAKEFEDRPVAVEKCEDFLSTTVPKWIGKLKNRTWIKDAEVETLTEKAESLRKWLEENTAEQEKLSLTEPPHFNSSQVYARISIVKKAASRLLSKKKPKPPPKPLDYVRCESGKNKTSCGRCTHYASGCTAFNSCKANNTRYALYGKSKCTYSKTEEGCVYAPSDYACFKGVPKKSEKAEKTAKSESSETSEEETAGGEKPTSEKADENSTESEETTAGGDESSEGEKKEEPKDEL